MERIVT